MALTSAVAGRNCKASQGTSAIQVRVELASHGPAPAPSTPTWVCVRSFGCREMPSTSGRRPALGSRVPSLPTTHSKRSGAREACATVGRRASRPKNVLRGCSRAREVAVVAMYTAACTRPMNTRSKRVQMYAPVAWRAGLACASKMDGWMDGPMDGWMLRMDGCLEIEKYDPLLFLLPIRERGLPQGHRDLPTLAPVRPCYSCWSSSCTYRSPPRHHCLPGM